MIIRHEDYLDSSKRYPGVRRNVDYRVLGDSSYEHRAVWERHHGVKLGDDYIVHHKNERKKDNRVCADSAGFPGHCPVWDCGNLAAMTRADHIRDHKPGRMGGSGFPGHAPKRQYACETCGGEMSRNGTRCRSCYLACPQVA